jgi:F-type H+-transporting ATPase subunit delta
MEKVASRYAQALFEYACELNKVDLWQQQMRLVHQVFQQDAQIVDFFSHIRIEADQKKSVFKQIFSERTDSDVVNFFCLLIDKRRVSQFSEIAKEFHILCNQSKGIKEGVVYSTRLLDIEEIKQIERSVSEKMKLNVELTNKLDPQLLSGVRVIVDDVVMDGSLKNRIDSLRHVLLKGSR